MAAVSEPALQLRAEHGLTGVADDDELERILVSAVSKRRTGAERPRGRLPETCMRAWQAALVGPKRSRARRILDRRTKQRRLSGRLPGPAR